MPSIEYTKHCVISHDLYHIYITLATNIAIKQRTTNITFNKYLDI